MPGVFDVAGAAGSSTTVTVNGSSTGVTRHGEYFFKGHALSNSPNPVYTTLTISDGTTSTNLTAFLAGTPEAMTYDDDGNLKSDGRWGYWYDAENRLYWVQTSSAASSAGHPIVAFQYYYDYLGRRIRTVEFSWSGSAWVPVDDHRLIYNGWNLVAEFWGPYAGGIFPTNYVRHSFWGLDLSGSLSGAGGVGGLLMVQEGGNSYLPAYDALGNVHAMIKASDGSLAAAYEYDAFGQTLREAGPYAASNPFRYSTKYTDIETGLIYYGYRYYSPSVGRFINRDPITEAGGLNLYAFVNNQPTNAIDYLGLDMIFGVRVGKGLSDPGHVLVGVTAGDKVRIFDWYATGGTRSVVRGLGSTDASVNADSLSVTGARDLKEFMDSRPNYTFYRISTTAEEDVRALAKAYELRDRANASLDDDHYAVGHQNCGHASCQVVKAGGQSVPGGDRLTPADFRREADVLSSPGGSWIQIRSPISTTTTSNSGRLGDIGPTEAGVHRMDPFVVESTSLTPGEAAAARREQRANDRLLSSELNYRGLGALAPVLNGDMPAGMLPMTLYFANAALRNGDLDEAERLAREHQIQQMKRKIAEENSL